MKVRFALLLAAGFILPALVVGDASSQAKGQAEALLKVVIKEAEYDTQCAEWHALTRCDPADVASALRAEVGGKDDARAGGAWGTAAFQTIPGLSKDAIRQLQNKDRATHAAMYLIWSGDAKAADAGFTWFEKQGPVGAFGIGNAYRGRHRLAPDIERLFVSLKDGKIERRTEASYVELIAWQVDAIGADKDALIKDWKNLIKARKDADKAAEQRRKAYGTARVTATIELGEGKMHPSNRAPSVLLSPDGKYAVVRMPSLGRTDRGPIKIIGLEKAEVVAEVPQGSLSFVLEIAADSKTFAVSADNTVTIHELPTGNAVRALEVKRVNNAFTLHPDGLHFLIHDGKGVVTQRSLADGEIVSTHNLPTPEGYSISDLELALSADGKKLAHYLNLFGGRNSPALPPSVRVMDLETGKLEFQGDVLGRSTGYMRLRGFRAGGTQLSVMDGTPTVFDIASGKRLRGMTGGKWDTALAARNTDALELSWDDQWGYLSDIETGHEVFRFVPPYREPADMDQIASMASSTDGKLTLMLMRPYTSDTLEVNGKYRLHVWRAGN